MTHKNWHHYHNATSSIASATEDTVLTIEKLNAAISQMEAAMTEQDNSIRCSVRDLHQVSIVLTEYLNSAK